MEKIYIVLGSIFFILSIASIAMVKGTNTIKLISLGVYLAVVGFLYVKMPNSFFSTIFPFVILPSLLVGALMYLYGGGSEPPIDKSKLDPVKDLVMKTTKGEILVKNINAGVLIFGGSGAGKTASVIYPIMKFIKDRAGIIYDYKDGELTEIALPIFGDRLKIVAVHRADISKRVNVIHPRYLFDEKSINSIVKVLLDNLNDTDSKGGNSFFYDGAESLLSAIILRFKMDYPQYCTLPHVIAFILACDFIGSDNQVAFGEKPEVMPKLKNFLTENKRVQIQASPFLLGLGSERQSAAVLSTLANALRKVAYPDAFWTLSGDDIRLDVNNPDNNTVIAFFNEPKNSPAITPLISCLVSTVMKQMMIRNANPSFLLFDEAATMKFRGLSETVATMRSFGTATIYCAQDISQGNTNYGKDGFKQITANLSTQFFGKANDPDTAQFYENFMELKKETSISKTNSGGGLFGGGKQSTTKSEKEVAKIRKDEFIKFQTGKFAFLSAGKQKVVQFPNPTFEVEKLPNTDNLRKNIDLNYNEIIEEMLSFADEL